MYGTAFYAVSIIICRYSGAPVDFETVEISGSMTDPDVMKDALLSVGRNGVAIKGTYRFSMLRLVHYLD